MEKLVSKWFECILRDKDFNETGVQSPISYSSYVAACAVGSILWLSVPPPFVNNPSGSSPFAHIFRCI